MSRSPAPGAVGHADRLRQALVGVRRRPDGDDWRASWTELFFDLVFVLVVTQLSSLLEDDLSASGAAQALFLLLVAWWAWIYTTWSTNWFDPDTAPVRAVLIVGMLASMLGAAAIPDAFGERALLLVIGYVAIQSLRNAFMVLATEHDDPLRPSLVRIFVWNAWVGALWLLGALVSKDARIAVWIVALVADYAGPLAGHRTPALGRSDPRDWDLEPSHFSERLMLFLIIALGETIVAAGVTASELDLTAGRLTALVVAFAIAVALWALYFDFHAEGTLARLRGAARDRTVLARDLSYLMVPLVAGIIVSAVASEIVIRTPGRTLDGAELVALGAGPALYLLGSVAFKVRVYRGLWGRRAVGVVLVAAATAAGLALPALATWTLMLAILAWVGVAEARSRRAGEAPATQTT